LRNVQVLLAADLIQKGTKTYIMDAQALWDASYQSISIHIRLCVSKLIISKKFVMTYSDDVTTSMHILETTWA